MLCSKSDVLEVKEEKPKLDELNDVFITSKIISLILL